LIVVLPLKVLELEEMVSVSVPVPFLVRAPVPVMAPERVWLLFEPKMKLALFEMAPA